MKVKNGDSFSYALSFRASNNHIEGRSVTKLKNGQSPTTAIRGSFDKKNQIFSFAEYEADKKNAITCFLSAQLHLIQNGKAYYFEGNFKGLDHYQKYCGEGIIKLYIPPEFYSEFISKSSQNTPQPINNVKNQKTYQRTIAPMNKDLSQRNAVDTSAITNQFKQTNNIKDKSHPSEQKLSISTNQQSKPIQLTNNLKDNDDNREYEITSGVTQQFLWSSDTCILDIYDGGVIDSDIVTVAYNGVEILSRYNLTKHKYRLKLFLKNKTNNILIIAENLGKSPPNTANIILIDGKRHYKIKAFNDIGESAEITLKKNNH